MGPTNIHWADKPPALAEQHRTALKVLLLEYQDVISQSDKDLEKIPTTQHHMDMGQYPSVRQPFRNKPLAAPDVDEDHVKQMKT